MRSISILVMVVSGCAHVAAPTQPEWPDDFAIANAALPLPIYRGAKWTSTCAVQLEPASADEQAARLAAMQTWFPGAKITLATLGDRARLIELPSRGTAPARRGDAEELGRHVVELAAPLFGARPDGYNVEVAETKKAWLVDVKMTSSDYTRAPGEHDVAVVARIDRTTGAIRIGLVDDLLPIMPACEHAPPPIEVQRVIAAVIAHPMPHRGAPITADDMVFDGVVEAAPERDGLSSHGVIKVAVGSHLASLACGVDRESWATRSAESEIVDVDATTYEVVGYETPQWINFDPSGVRLNPRYDAVRAFSARHHRRR